MTARRDYALLAAPLWIGGFVMLHSLPHTGALRSLLLLFGCANALLLWRRYAPPWRAVAGGAEGWLLAALTAWLLLQSALLAPAPGPALSALAADWGKALLGAAMGAAVALAARRAGTPPTLLPTAVFCGFFVHVLLTIGYQAWLLARTGQTLPGESPLGNYGYVSPLVNGAFAMLLADAAQRLCGLRRLLPLAHGGLVAALLATLVANALLAAKAGLVLTLALTAAALLAVAAQRPSWRRRILLGLLALLIVTVAAINFAPQSRWAGAMQAIADGLDTHGNHAWLDATLQTYAGTAIGSDPSFYLRTAWAKVAVAGIAAHPLGLGFGADAFGREVLASYGVGGFISSHSGWLDFALANGLPGLALLLALAGALMRRGWKDFARGGGGLALLLVTLNYIGRSAIDGNLTGSRLAGYAIVAGVLWGLAAPTSASAAKEAA
jgi:hypothetical protein